MGKSRRTRGAGTIRQLKSGRYQARFRWDDGVLHPAPETFETRLDAAAWLKSQTEARRDDSWEPPVSMSRDTGTTTDAYFERWILQKDALAPGTLENYRSSWRRLVSPTFGQIKIRRINQAMIEDWYQTLDKSTPKGTNDTYALMRQVFAQAVRNKVIKENPVEPRKKITSTPRDSVILRPDQIKELAELMSGRFEAAVLISGWMGLRIGELLALRRQDVDMVNRRISVTRSVTRTDGSKTVKQPKSRAGVRTIAIPPNIVECVQNHLDKYTGIKNSDLLFTGEDGDYLAEQTLTNNFRRHRDAIGYPDMHWHDLRHTAGTLATQAGMNMAQVMQMMGHSTHEAAMRYQSAVHELKDMYATRLAALDPTYSGE